MSGFLRGIIVAVAVMYFISPDAFPGPIDDFLLLFLAVSIPKASDYIE